MRNFLATSVAVGMIAGGFGLTGDLGWIAEHGKRVLGAADVPAAREQPDVAPPVRGWLAPPRPEAPPLDPTAAPPARQTAGFRPPAGGPDQVPWAALAPGSRVVVWLAAAPFRCVVLDFVDPASGEALLYDVAAFSAEGRPVATAGPPRRVIVGRDPQGRPLATGIVRGGLLHVAAVGPAARSGGEWLGPVTALAVGG